MHKLLLEDDYKPSRGHKKRLNSNISEMVNKEVVKLLDVRVIYTTSNSKWANSI